MRRCVTCETLFTPSHTREVCCSKWCKSRRRNRLSEASRSKQGAHWTPCADCAKPVRLMDTSAMQPRCSACRDVAGHPCHVQRTAKNCQRCGESYSATSWQAFCSASCRRAARNKRRSASPNTSQDFLLNSVAYLHGVYAPKSKVVRCSRSVGLMVLCPWCEGVMGAAGPANRFCPSCATEVRLNSEEVDAIDAGLIPA